MNEQEKQKQKDGLKTLAGCGLILVVMFVGICIVLGLFAFLGNTVTG